VLLCSLLVLVGGFLAAGIDLDELCHEGGLWASLTGDVGGEQVELLVVLDPLRF
jgi:hypothetical protein